MIITKTRNYLELRVGLHHSVELVLCARRDHFNWFNGDSQHHLEQVIDLLSNTVIPRQCGTFLEAYWHKKDPKRFPKVEEEKIGEKNTQIKAAKKRKRTKKKTNVGQDMVAPKPVPEKDVYYSFGDGVTLCYKVHDVDVYSSVTMAFQDGFTQLYKLPKRFEVWAYPSDEENPPSFHRPDLVPIANLFKEAPPSPKKEVYKKKRTK